MPATLESLATPIVVTATPESTAVRAAQMMREYHVGSLVVVDGASDSGKPVGIVTDRDLVLAVMAEGLDPSLFTVGDIMSVELVTAPASADLLDATQLLRRHRVRRVSHRAVGPLACPIDAAARGRKRGRAPLRRLDSSAAPGLWRKR
jgi:CBS domain-containing protein